MIRNEVKLIGRLTADPELKYTKNSNTPVCNVVLAVNNIYNDDAEYLHLVFWDKKATNLCKYKGKIMRCQNQKIYHFNGGKNYVQNHFSR